MSWRSTQTRPGQAFSIVWTRLSNRSNHWSLSLSPIWLFLLYAAMLLPIYENLEVSLSLRTLKVKAFTLIEMLVVCWLLSVLLLLFVPNLTKQKRFGNGYGNPTVVKSYWRVRLSSMNSIIRMKKAVFLSLSQKDKSLKTSEAYRAICEDASVTVRLEIKGFYPSRELTNSRYRQPFMLAAKLDQFIRSFWAGGRNVFSRIWTGLSRDTKDELVQERGKNTHCRPGWDYSRIKILRLPKGWLD